MKQVETQVQLQQPLGQKRKWSWKKIAIFSGAATILITGSGLTAWAITKQYLNTRINTIDEEAVPALPKIVYQAMLPEQFDKIHDKFSKIKNVFIRQLATEQLQFYLPTTVYKEIRDEVPSSKQTNSTFDLTPNLSKLLTEKMINSVGSNLRVWGLNKGYAFDPDYVKINFNLNAWTVETDLADEKQKECIKFDLELGYKDSEETFELKGKLKDSEGITQPISDFSQKNLAKIFKQANEIFNSRGSGLNRQGYFIGLDFQGSKDSENDFAWTSDQQVNLQEFNTQTWDYILNSLKNFNLVKEDVFVNGLQLFNLEGWKLGELKNGLTGELLSKVKEYKEKNYIWLAQENDFGAHSIISTINVAYKNNEKINFAFTGSYLQNQQWGNY